MKNKESNQALMRAAAKNNDAYFEAKAEAGCSMGVGCLLVGVCYAEKMGKPDLCPKAQNKKQCVAIK